MSIFAEYWTASRIVNDKVLGGANFSESTTEHKWTVPQGEKWRILTATFKPDVSGTISVSILDADAQQSQILLSEAAGTAIKSWPQNGVEGSWGYVYYLGEGEVLRVVFGAAQSSAGYVQIRYEVVYV